MKITKIRFENIHSLKGEHEINFSSGPLAEAGLFAITGPTGSGKSTLLDIITLALYNRIARVDKTISNTVLEDDGGVMTRNMRSCYAEVQYTANGNEYRSYWSIERNRNNNLSSRKQELVEVATGTILESGTKTPDKNVEIIGLSYDQFVKAIVLSQGEFSKLLQAPRNERNKLLEDITGARSYREIGKAVYQKFSGFKEKVKLKEAGLENLEVMPADLLKARKKELEVLILSKPQIEKAYHQASEKINVRKELLKKLDEQKQLEANKTILKEHQDRFALNKEQLEKHEKLVKYQPALGEYDLANKEAIKAVEQTDNLQKQKKELEIQQNNYLAVASKLVGAPLQLPLANEKLEAFRSQVNSLLSLENMRQAEAQLYHVQVKDYAESLIPLGYNFTGTDNISSFKNDLRSLKITIKNTIDQSGLKSLDGLNSQMQLLRDASENALQLLNKKEQSLKLQKNLDTYRQNLIEGNEQIARDVNTITAIEKEIAILEKEIAEQSAILEHQRKHQSLEQYRNQLQPDAPCPLCGSLDHPYAMGAPHFDLKEEVLKESQKLLRTKSELAVGHRQKIKFQEEANIRFEKDIKQLEKEHLVLEEQLQLISNKLEWDYGESLDNLIAKRRELNTELQKLDNSKKAFEAQNILINLEKSGELWEKSTDEYTALKKQRIQLYPGNNIDKDTNSLSTNITRSLAQLSELQVRLKENALNISEIAKVLKLQKEALDKIIVVENLKDVTELRSSILEEDTASGFRRKNTQLQEGAIRLFETEKLITLALETLLSKDNLAIPQQELEDAFDRARAQWNELSVNIGKITESLEKDERTRQKLQTALKELESLKKDLVLWKTMNDLIGDANGHKFSNFVQDLTLEQLIGYANRRLMEFSDRYILDIPTAEEAEKSDTLKILDRYMGNARRSVRTLSGGETFLVSLSMAFALSDIAARNVKIESLFIDEGFGTLDPDTLDQAITILERMQNEGDKSVGIISHVSALKERITTQIKLEKGSLGYSTIEIVQ